MIWKPNFNENTPAYKGGGSLGEDGLYRFKLLKAEDHTGDYGTSCWVSLEVNGQERLIFLNYPSNDPKRAKQDKWAHREWLGMLLAVGYTMDQLRAFTGATDFDTLGLLQQAVGMEGPCYVYAGDGALPDGDNWKWDITIPLDPVDAQAIEAGDESKVPRKPSRYLKKGSPAQLAGEGGQAPQGPSNGNGHAPPPSGVMPPPSLPRAPAIPQAPQAPNLRPPSAPTLGAPTGAPPGGGALGALIPPPGR